MIRIIRALTIISLLILTANSQQVEISMNPPMPTPDDEVTMDITVQVMGPTLWHECVIENHDYEYNPFIYIDHDPHYFSISYPQCIYELGPLGSGIYDINYSIQFSSGGIDEGTYQFLVQDNWMFGDLNNDHVHDVSDVSLMIGVILETIDDFYMLLVGDITQDSSIDIMDIVHLIDLILNG